jgi:hypothetical protein
VPLVTEKSLRQAEQRKRRRDFNTQQRGHSQCGQTGTPLVSAQRISAKT